MDDLQKLLLEDLQKCAVGEISNEEMERKMEYYKAQLGDEKYNEVINPSFSEEPFDALGLFMVTQELDELAQKELPGLEEVIKMKNEAFVGKFLINRLKLEHLVTKLIYERYGAELSLTEGDINGLKFFQRLKFLPVEGRLYKNYMPVLFSLNVLRNKLVHDPAFDINEYNPQDLLFYMGAQIKNETRYEVILSIMENAIKYMILETKAMESKKNEILASYPNIKDILIN